MRLLLKFRYIIPLPVILYRFSLSSPNEILFGIKSDTYLLVFLLLSIAQLLIDMYLYTRYKGSLRTYFGDKFESVLIFIVSSLLFLYCIYVFQNSGGLYFMAIGVVYLINSLFWGIVYFRTRRISK